MADGMKFPIKKILKSKWKLKEEEMEEHKKSLINDLVTSSSSFFAFV